MSRFAPLPKPPYYAVMFSSQKSENSQGYDDMAKLVVELAETMNGYIGHESSRDQTGFGITISYWHSEDAIKAWHTNAKHQIAQKLGKERWYDHYVVRVAKVERQYDGP